MMDIKILGTGCPKCKALEKAAKDAVALAAADARISKVEDIMQIMQYGVMTAAELIKHLKQIHPDTKIVVRGYEDGYNDILKLRKVRIKYYPDAECYYGVYSDSKDPDSIDAIDLYGENPNEKK